MSVYKVHEDFVDSKKGYPFKYGELKIAANLFAQSVLRHSENPNEYSEKLIVNHAQGVLDLLEQQEPR